MGLVFKQMHNSSHHSAKSQAGKEAEKEPTPCSSKLAAPIRGLTGREMFRIGSMLFPVLAFGAFLGCRRRRRGGGGLGLRRFCGLATATSRGFAVAGGRGGGYGGRSICGFAHSIKLMFIGCDEAQSEVLFARDVPAGVARGKGRQGIVP